MTKSEATEVVWSGTRSLQQRSMFALMLFLGLRGARALRPSAPAFARGAGTTRRRAAYDVAEVEGRWQRYWDDEQTFATSRTAGREKKYVLDMFPYPSGSGLHVGHPEGYTASDIMARYW